MVSVYDMRSGLWIDGEDEDGPGRGGCRRPPEPLAAPGTPVPRLQLALQPVAREGQLRVRHGR
jgi:hypothetical protein